MPAGRPLEYTLGSIEIMLKTHLRKLVLSRDNKNRT